MTNQKTEIVIETDNNPDHQLIEEKAIENNGDTSKKKGFFTARNIIIILFFFAISITLLAVTIVFVLKIDFNLLFATLSNGFAFKIGILWFFLLVFYFVYQMFSYYATLWLRLKKLGYKISQWEYWFFGASVAFLRAVTPVLFSDPYTLFWLKTKGVSTSRATSLLFSNTLFWQFVQFAITFPSFVWVLIYRDYLFTTPDGISAFTFMCAGIVTDIGCIAFMVALNMSKKMHSGMSKIFNWIKKKLHMKYHTKAEIEHKYKEKAVIRRDFIEYMKDWKTTLWIIAIFSLNELVLYFAICWSIFFVQYTTHPDFANVIFQAKFNFLYAFNCANVTFTANRLNFISPNGEGTLQIFLKAFLVNLGDFKFDVAQGTCPAEQIPFADLTESTTNNAILIWRTFGAYFPAVIGLCCFGTLTAKQIRNYKKSHTIVEAPHA